MGQQLSVEESEKIDFLIVRDAVDALTFYNRFLSTRMTFYRALGYSLQAYATLIEPPA